MKFSNAYSSPICSPTRASILTGQNPARHGMTSPSAHLPEVRLDVTAQTRGLPNQKSCKLKTPTRIRKEVPTLGEILKNNGYQTAHFGKWHLGREGYTPLENGFDIDLTGMVPAPNLVILLRGVIITRILRKEQTVNI